MIHAARVLPEAQLDSRDLNRDTFFERCRFFPFVIPSSDIGGVYMYNIYFGKAIPSTPASHALMPRCCHEHKLVSFTKWESAT